MASIWRRSLEKQLKSFSFSILILYILNIILISIKIKSLNPPSFFSVLRGSYSLIPLSGSFASHNTLSCICSAAFRTTFATPSTTYLSFISFVPVTIFLPEASSYNFSQMLRLSWGAGCWRSHFVCWGRCCRGWFVWSNWWFSRRGWTDFGMKFSNYGRCVICIIPLIPLSIAYRVHSQRTS